MRVCVCYRQRGDLLTGDLKLECTFLNFENGVLGKEGKETIADNNNNNNNKSDFYSAFHNTHRCFDNITKTQYFS